jgi:hypothetical protein
VGTISVEPEAAAKQSTCEHDRPELLGTFVRRAQALELENIDHLWHVADHIVPDDVRLTAVRKWLEGGSQF